MFDPFSETLVFSGDEDDASARLDDGDQTASDDDEPVPSKRVTRRRSPTRSFQPDSDNEREPAPVRVISIFDCFLLKFLLIYLACPHRARPSFY